MTSSWHSRSASAGEGPKGDGLKCALEQLRVLIHRGAMAAALLTFLCFTGFAAAFAGAGVALVSALFPDQDRKTLSAWLLPWGCRGLLLPAAIWLLMNVGLSWSIPAYMPQVQAAQYAGRAWMPPFLRVLGGGWLVISSCWGAVTVGWGLVLLGRKLRDAAKKEFSSLCWVGGGVMLLVAAGVFAAGGWLSLGVAAFVLLAPIAGYAPGMLFKKPSPPMYARAIARLKLGKYDEAEWEIIRQLENHEDDFEGWMMMAALYAEKFDDMAEAEQTILDICDQPKVTPSQLSIALHRLADWYLSLRADPDSARRALQMVCDRLPGTHLARMAHLRMNQIPTTSQDVRDQRTPSAIPLPALGDAFESLPDSEPPMDRATAVRAARDCVERLRKDPNNTVVRERFARLLAERLNDPDKAIEQLALLAAMKGQPESKRAEWLSLTAAYHLKHRQDVRQGREVLESITRDFPRTPQALSARRRLQFLDHPERR